MDVGSHDQMRTQAQNKKIGEVAAESTGHRRRIREVKGNLRFPLTKLIMDITPEFIQGIAATYWQ